MAIDLIEQRRQRRSARSGTLSSGGFELTGFADLEAKLKELPNNVARNATRRAMKRAGELMAEAQRTRAPHGATGNLAKSIRVTTRARNLTGLAEYSQALSSGGSHSDATSALRSARRESDSDGTRIFMLIGSTAPHAHLVEFGTVERFQKSGKSTGTMPMHPFIRPAFDSAKGPVLAAVGTELRVEIAKVSARLALKAARGG